VDEIKSRIKRFLVKKVEKVETKKIPEKSRKNPLKFVQNGQ